MIANKYSFYIKEHSTADDSDTLKVLKDILPGFEFRKTKKTIKTFKPLPFLNSERKLTKSMLEFINQQLKNDLKQNKNKKFDLVDVKDNPKFCLSLPYDESLSLVGRPDAVVVTDKDVNEEFYVNLMRIMFELKTKDTIGESLTRQVVLEMVAGLSYAYHPFILVNTDLSTYRFVFCKSNIIESVTTKNTDLAFKIMRFWLEKCHEGNGFNHESFQEGDLFFNFKDGLKKANKTRFEILFVQRLYQETDPFNNIVMDMYIDNDLPKNKTEKPSPSKMDLIGLDLEKVFLEMQDNKKLVQFSTRGRSGLVFAVKFKDQICAFKLYSTNLDPEVKYEMKNEVCQFLYERLMNSFN
jgi:hypothetical protein